MFSTILTNTLRKITPQAAKPLSIYDVYPVLVGQPERNQERIAKIIEEMGTKWILHPAHKSKKLKNKRPV